MQLLYHLCQTFSKLIMFTLKFFFFLINKRKFNHVILHLKAVSIDNEFKLFILYQTAFTPVPSYYLNKRKQSNQCMKTSLSMDKIAEHKKYFVKYKITLKKNYQEFHKCLKLARNSIPLYDKYFQIPIPRVCLEIFHVHLHKGIFKISLSSIKNPITKYYF